MRVNKKKPALERFEAKLRITPGCWLWTGSLATGGYGAFFFNGRLQRAHRVSYQLYVGPIPDGLYILHSCDVPACVNPDHLRPGTAFDNAKDVDARGRKGASRGPDNKNAKFTADQIRAIRADHLDYKTLAKVYGVHAGTIKAILERRSYRTVD